MNCFLPLVLCALVVGATGPNNNPSGSCNFDLTYDAYLTWIADVQLPITELITPITQENHDYLTPYCSSQFCDLFGIEVQPFFEGRGPLPDGWAGFNVTVNAYRVYTATSEEYPNNAPVTNGKVEDDAYYLFITRDLTITQGSWLKMAIQMGHNLTWPAGSFIFCGQYRAYQNSSDGTKQRLFPNILYTSPMPMTALWLGAVGDFVNSEVSINCDLFSSLWGNGRAIGMAHTELLSNGLYYARWRNTLSFPASIYDRASMQGRIPESTACEPLDV